PNPSALMPSVTRSRSSPFDRDVSPLPVFGAAGVTGGRATVPAPSTASVGKAGAEAVARVVALALANGVDAGVRAGVGLGSGVDVATGVDPLTGLQPLVHIELMSTFVKRTE